MSNYIDVLVELCNDKKNDEQSPNYVKSAQKLLEFYKFQKKKGVKH